MRLFLWGAPCYAVQVFGEDGGAGEAGAEESVANEAEAGAEAEGKGEEGEEGEEDDEEERPQLVKPTAIAVGAGEGQGGEGEGQQQEQPATKDEARGTSRPLPIIGRLNVRPKRNWHVPECIRILALSLTSASKKGASFPRRSVVTKDVSCLADTAFTTSFGLAAEFLGQGFEASMISVSKLCDAVAMLPGCDGEQSDATSAYTQSNWALE